MSANLKLYMVMIAFVLSFSVAVSGIFNLLFNNNTLGAILSNKIHNTEFEILRETISISGKNIDEKTAEMRYHISEKPNAVVLEKFIKWADINRLVVNLQSDCSSQSMCNYYIIITPRI